MANATLAQSQHLKTALAKLIDVCESMYEIPLKPAGSSQPLKPEQFAYGSIFSLVRPDGSWELALFGDEKSCHNFSRAAMMMEEDDELAKADVVDLLGETLNVVAGLIKQSVPGGDDLQLSVPHFLLGEDCRKYATRAIPVLSQPLRSDLFEGEIFVVWSERNAEALFEEVLAWLKGDDRLEKLSLTRALGALEEANETLGEEEESEPLDLCMGVVMALINDESAHANKAADSVVAAVEALLHNTQCGVGDEPREVPAPDAFLAPFAPSSQPAQRVERDDETIEMLSEFMEEATEGLESVDEILMNVENAGADAEQVNAMFRTFHSIKGLSSFYDLHEVTELGHKTENVLGKVRDGAMALEGVILDSVFESTALMRQLIDLLRHAIEASEELSSLPAVLPHVSRLEAIYKGEQVAPRKTEAPKPQAQPTTVTQAPKKKIKETIKVEVDHLLRLDKLVESLGALCCQGQEGQGLAEVHQGLSMLSMEMRMVTLQSLFKKMARMVRDLSKKTEKMMRIVLDGADTRVPRGMADKLNDPLVHMIRNAVDHGIETTAERKGSDKQLLATIRLAARRDKETVVVDIVDDGRGIDCAKVLEKAESKGIVEASSKLEKQDIYQLLFAPGFSTAAQVTSLSGRGVGMDVVKRNIASLGGQIVVDSALGKGSTFRIELPVVPPAASSS